MAMIRRVVVLGALITAPLAAQQKSTFPTSDPVAQRIFRVGMDSSWVPKLSQVLFDSIGPRLTASPGYTAAGDWVMKSYKEWGIDGKRHTYGTWRGWRRGTSHIDLMQPRVRSLEGQMLAWSPGTPGGRPVTAEVVILPKFADSTEFVKWLPSARGKIVALSPAWPTCRSAEEWNRFATPESRARIDTAVALMNRDYAVGDEGYRGTGYAMALGTGTLGVRLEKAGVAGMLTSRLKLSGFSNPFPAAGGREWVAES